MKYIITAVSFLLFLLSEPGYSQINLSWQTDKLILDNGAIKRTIEINNEKQTFVTTSIYHGNNEENYVSSDASGEFSFEINGITCTGRDSWVYVKHVAVRDDKQGEGERVTLKGTGEIDSLEIDITYLLYPDLPLIRKCLTFRYDNLRDQNKLFILNKK